MFWNGFYQTVNKSSFWGMGSYVFGSTMILTFIWSTHYICNQQNKGLKTTKNKSLENASSKTVSQ